MSLPQSTEQLSRALDRLESVTMPTAKKQPSFDLSEIQTERIIVGNLATLCGMADPEMVKRVLRKFADADEGFWTIICCGEEKKGV
jgi:hypothetical protein